MELPQGQGHEKPPPAANGRGAWRGGASSSSSAATPPKVYRVEPREFRDLVQRLTGAPPPTALRRPQQQQHQHRAAVVAPVVHPQPVRAGGGEQLAYGAAAPWSFSFPMAGGGVEAAAQPQHGAFL
jgi:hypothetical protein